MNALSWLIYLAGVTNSLSSFFVLLMVVLAVLTVILTIVSLIFLSDTDGKGNLLGPDRLAENKLIHKGSRRWAIRFGVLFVIVGCGNSILPDRKTVLLIAASEIGERTLNSEKMAAVGNRVASIIDPSIELLNTWIAKQTEEFKLEMDTARTAGSGGKRSPR